MRLWELYQESSDSQFEHDGQQYDLNHLLKITDGSEIHDIPLDQLKWILDWDDADPKRVKSADKSAPILVTWWSDEEEDTHKLVVLDGLHRTTRALKDGDEYIQGIYVDEDDLSLCKIK